MKTHYLKTIIMALSIGVAASMPCVAQDTTYSVTLPSHHALIRTVKNDHFVIYNANNSDQYFCGWTAGNSSLATARLNTLANLHIKDMAVLENRYVFFCGRRDTAATWGYFDMQELDNNTLTNITFWDLHIGGLRSDSLCRLEVFRAPIDNSVHVVFVGELFDQAYNIMHHAVVDIALTPLLTFYSARAMTYIKNHERYYDIAVSDRYVFTADQLNANYAWRLYDKPMSISASIFSTPLYTSTVYFNADPTPTQVLSSAVTHTYFDEFLMATPIPGNRIVLSWFNGATPFTDLRIDVPGFTIGNIVDMSSNNQKTNIVVEARNLSGNNTPLLVQTGWPYSSPATTVVTTKSPSSSSSNIDFMSVAVPSIPTPFTACVGPLSSSNLGILRYVSGPPCSQNVTYGISPAGVIATPDTYDTEIYTPNFTPTPINVIMGSAPIAAPCP